MTNSDWHILIVALAAYFIGWVSGRAAGRRSAVGGMQVYAPPVPAATLANALPIERWQPYAAEQFERHMRRGEKINAIKIYRDQTGVGLKDAKDAVDSLAAHYGSVSPQL